MKNFLLFESEAKNMTNYFVPNRVVWNAKFYFEFYFIFKCACSGLGMDPKQGVGYRKMRTALSLHCFVEKTLVYPLKIKIRSKNVPSLKF